MIDLFNYSRRESSVARVGDIEIGGKNPIRVQSMTTTDTNDTQACVEQAERIIQKGGELVRLTTQGIKEAENLKCINDALKKKGYCVPLVADVHFNPRVADVAATTTAKVRINPGNYVDPARTFKVLEYTDEEYANELQKIEDRFMPFLNICKKNKTAIRIGVNHGSLSDRIRNRYGDTPEGIVESCMEFLRICKREQFNDVVISIKSSNTVVMVRAMRLLVNIMEKEDMNYPLHLGVTEAGEGEDGRIKSAVGIGALLSDGIGDTIRVSLSEEPEEEIPVAKYLCDYITSKTTPFTLPATEAETFSFTHPSRRKTHVIGNIGGEKVPVVVLSKSSTMLQTTIEEEETTLNVTSKIDKPEADYIYVGSQLPNKINEKQGYIVDYNAYDTLKKANPNVRIYPIFPHNAIPFIASLQADTKFLVLQYGADSNEYLPCLKAHSEVVVISMAGRDNLLGNHRALVHELMINNITNPVIFAQMYMHTSDEDEQFLLEASADMGALMIDGLTDGIWLMNAGSLSPQVVENTSFGILQAARLRVSKTEYISCPGCGRTLYNLRTTIARIKSATEDMKGLKIGIMGCIVNGPGEMADADYGYVGAGPGKVSLYRKQECVERNISEEEAVERLLALIKRDKESN